MHIQADRCPQAVGKKEKGFPDLGGTEVMTLKRHSELGTAPHPHLRGLSLVLRSL